MTLIHTQLCELNDKMVDATFKTLQSSSNSARIIQLEICKKLLDLMNGIYYKYNVGFFSVLRIAMACALNLKKFFF